MVTILPQKSLLFSQGDTVLFNTEYIRYAQQYRTDVTVFNTNGLIGDAQFQKFKKEYLKKAREHDSSKATIKTIEYLSEKYPVFSVTELPVDKEYVWVPYGMVEQLVKKKELPTEEVYKKTQESIWKRLHIPVRNEKSLSLENFTISEIPTDYSNALVTNGYFFYSQYHDKKEALNYFKKAQEIDKTNPKVYKVLGVYYTSISKNCDLAKDALENAISLDPFDNISYFTLYETAKICGNNREWEKQVISQYQNTFHSDFLKDIKSNGKNQ
jgi:tetratricopeptide (TPR) repeat protein